MNDAVKANFKQLTCSTKSCFGLIPLFINAQNHNYISYSTVIQEVMILRVLMFYEINITRWIDHCPYLDRFYPHINLNIPFAQYG